MDDITREQLHAYLDDALNDIETARVERALRSSEKVRDLLLQVREERHRGEHSLGGIWRAERLSCPSREQMTNFVLGAMAPDEEDYIRFHLETIGCHFCIAIKTDLENQNQNTSAETQRRRKHYFDSSKGMLPPPATDESPKPPRKS